MTVCINGSFLLQLVLVVLTLTTSVPQIDTKSTDLTRTCAMGAERELSLVWRPVQNQVHFIVPSFVVTLAIVLLHPKLDLLRH